mgnify:CR=1 FL=1
MKKIIISCLTLLVIACGIFIWIKTENKENDKLTKVKLVEVAHSVFYAPQYLADSLGYFEEEGLDVNINLAAGADAVMAAVLSGDADVGFCGTEATIYVIA